MTVPFERDFDPAENFPSVVMDALQRMITAGFAPLPVPIRIKPGAANTLQVPADTGQDAVGLVVDGHWRWNEAATEQAGSGGAGPRDIWAVTGASDYEAGSPGETDETDRSFELRVTAVDAGAPGGFAHTRKVARGWWSGTIWLDVVAFVGGVVRPEAPPLVTELPATPVDGQEVYFLADASNGVVWHLRHRAAASGAYKWESVGGRPMYHNVDASQTRTVTTHGDLATVGPTLTLPLAGVYDFSGDADSLLQGATTAEMALQIGASVPALGDGSTLGNQNSLSGHVRVVDRLEITPAGTVAKLVYLSGVGGVTVRFAKRRLTAQPVRVG